MTRFCLLAVLTVVFIFSAVLAGCARGPAATADDPKTSGPESVTTSPAAETQAPAFEDPFGLTGTWRNEEGDAFTFEQDGTYSIQTSEWGGAVIERGTWEAEQHGGGIVKAVLSPTHEYVQLFDGERPTQGSGFVRPMAESFDMTIEKGSDVAFSISGPSFEQFAKAQAEVEAALADSGSATYTDIHGKSHSIEGALVASTELEQRNAYFVIEGDELAFYSKVAAAEAGKKPNATYVRE